LKSTVNSSRPTFSEYRAHVAHRDTGIESDVVVVASSSSDAEARLNSLGYLVQSVTSFADLDVASPSVPPATQTRLRALPTSVQALAVALLGAVLWLTLRQLNVDSGAVGVRDNDLVGSRSAQSSVPPASKADPHPPTATIAQVQRAPARLTSFDLPKPYFVVPIRGSIGDEGIHAEEFKASVRRGLGLGARSFIVVIDSPGGVVAEAEEIVDVIAELPPSVRTIAAVRNAISAAMFVAVACDEIFIDDPGTIGAAVSYRPLFETGSVEVDAKFNSALAAKVSAVAEHNGHSGDVVRAMIVMDNVLWATREGEGAERRRIASSRPPQDQVAAWELLDSEKTVLTLDHLQAIRLGLARPGVQLVSATQIASSVGNEVGKDEAERMIESAVRERKAERHRQLRALQEAAKREEEARERQKQQAIEKIETLSDEVRRTRERFEESQQREAAIREVRSLVIQIPDFVAAAIDADPGKLSDYRGWNDPAWQTRAAAEAQYLANARRAIDAWQRVRAGIDDIADRMKRADIVQHMQTDRVILEREYFRAEREINRIRNGE
jgi:hypothetical protein